VWPCIAIESWAFGTSAPSDGVFVICVGALHILSRIVGWDTWLSTKISDKQGTFSFQVGYDSCP
jgi:hypothetical protein